MINIFINQSDFEYDIHSLAKAFFPETDVKVSACADTFSSLWEEAPGHKDARAPEEGEDLTIFICWGEGELKIRHSKGGEEQVCLPTAPGKLDRKNAVKQALYRLLSKYQKRELPWGALTGIRPTRLAMDYLKRGNSPRDTKAHMMDMYFTSAGKASLSVDIACREMEIIREHPYHEGYSLYVGIPFCPTTCMYCSFTSYSVKAYEKQVDVYLDSLLMELKECSRLFAGKTLYSVYVGGGTPTSLSPSRLDRILSGIEACFDLSNIKEFTVEAGRPDSITTDKLQALYKHGVDRISVNPQTMNQETLDIIGRRHTVEETVRAFHLARDCGFHNINMDIILGLPGEGEDHIKRTMEALGQLGPDSLTIHSLSVKRASRLAEYVQEHGRGELNNSERLMDIATRSAGEMGMKPYYLYRQKNMTGNLENTGYALPGKYGIYNILMMEEVHDILACGPGTVSKRVFQDGRIERCDDVKDLKLYLEKTEEMILRKRELFS